MRLSQYFLPLLRENPSEAQIVSHRLMLRAGMIRQSSAGIYSWLPLGLRVLQKICQIVREEQDRSGAIELLMPTIQSAELWRESGRYDDYGKEMLRIEDRHEREMLYGPTNEEMITEIFRSYVRSYKDLPLNLYHIQWKFRDEVRPRFGLMRGREFLMKDAYSFEFDDVAGLHNIVDRCTGHDTATSEKHDAAAFARLPADKQMSARGIEVGHIFYFGTKYSEPMKAVVAGPDGVERPVHMGSYGIGPSRLVAAIIEAFHDDAGIKWPEAVAPFRVAILNLKQGGADTDAACEQLYRALGAKGVEVLYNDLDERPGAKFAATDLIGIPWQILVGPKGLAEGKVELKCRADGSRQLLTPANALDRLAGPGISNQGSAISNQGSG